METVATTTDTTFITNEGEKNLRERFRVLIKDTRFFDVLVGYFYTSGFYALYKSLESTEKIRILIGISTSKQTFDTIQKAQSPVQGAFQFSHSETKEEFSNTVAGEMEDSEDNSNVEEGVNKFIEWLQKGKQLRKPSNLFILGMTLVVLGIIFVSAGRLISYSFIGVGVLLAIIDGIRNLKNK